MLKKTSLFSLATLAIAGYIYAGVLVSSAHSQTRNSGISSNAPANLRVPGNEDYILGPGDQIKFTMFGQTELFDDSGYLVNTDGTIGLPYIGRVAVQGLSVKQTVALITQKYGQDFFKRPLISATVVSHRPINISISGEILRPGLYPLTGENPTNMTLTQVLKLAGGTTQAADISQIQVKRLVSGGSKTVQVDLTRLLRNSEINQDLVLRDGDAVIVPAVKSYDPIASELIARANFSAANNEPLRISVVGEVYRPGSYLASPSNNQVNEAGQQGTASSVAASPEGSRPTLTQAIQLAGGIKPEANVRKIEVRREISSGEKQLINIDLWKLLESGDLSQDITLQQGDVIFIPTVERLAREEEVKIAAASFSPNTIDVSVVGEVRSPGLQKVPPSSPLSSALMAAGGFDPRRAKTNAVDLIRLNPDGSITQRRIPINFAAGINEETNPALRNNDVIVVKRSGFSRFSDTVGTILSPGFSIFGILRIFGGE